MANVNGQDSVTEDLVIIRGSIDSMGSIKCGRGFTVVKSDEAGIFTIVFDNEFRSRPTVVASQNYPGLDDFEQRGGSVLDNVVIIAVNSQKCKLKTGSAGGGGEHRSFEFIAVGPKI